MICLQATLISWSVKHLGGPVKPVMVPAFTVFRFTKSVTVLMFMIAVRVTGTEVPKQAIDKVMCQSRFPSPIDMA